ncbi:MAG: hypothetical protein MMC33_009580 [Icmadophila ericetorum]|nr:hypothetical protein [Icmadophila ericetorum]
MSKLDINSKYRMLSGYEIPVLGFGVYQTPAKEAEEACLNAFKAGYRHIDCARAYGNEVPCGVAVKKSGIPRSEIFFNSKIPRESMGYESAAKEVDASLKATGLDYLDLCLIHSPYGGPEKRKGTWKALVEAKEAGKIRSIGVSNYSIAHLEELAEYIKELEREKGEGKGGEISIGQWEIHPWCERQEIVDWCKAHDVVCEAYSPVVQATRFDEPVLKPLTKKYGKTPAQVLLRWSLQKGLVPLPKSVTPKRIVENTEIYDFGLTEEEVKSLETGEYAPVCWDPVKTGIDN